MAKKETGSLIPKGPCITEFIGKQHSVGLIYSSRNANQISKYHVNDKNNLICPPKQVKPAMGFLN